MFTASNNWRRFLNSDDSGSESPPSKTLGGSSGSEVGGEEGAELESGAMVERLGGRDVADLYSASTDVLTRHPPRPHVSQALNDSSA